MSARTPGKFGDPPPVGWEKRLQWIAWASIALPLIAFGYLSYRSIELARQMQQSRSELSWLAEQRNKLKQEVEDLEGQRALLVEEKRHYSELAGIRVVFFRKQDSDLISTALAKIGLQAELRPTPKISKGPDTLAYGPKVSPSDCKAVALALVDAGFPLRGIAPATMKNEASLLQIYNSASTNPDSPLYTAERIRNEAVCGAEAK